MFERKEILQFVCCFFPSNASFNIDEVKVLAVADPGFARGGGTNSKGGCEKLLFIQFFPKKLHEFGP